MDPATIAQRLMAQAGMDEASASQYAYMISQDPEGSQAILAELGLGGQPFRQKFRDQNPRPSYDAAAMRSQSEQADAAIKDPMRRGLIDALTNTGLSPGLIEGIVAVADFVPFVGGGLGGQDAVLAADEARRDPTLGNIAEAGVLGGGAFLGAIGVPGAPRAAKGLVAAGKKVFGGATPPGIKAYHGSPHDFDKFDLSNIGTGEGAQAEGFGLYFGENPKVADYYRDSVSGNAPDFNDMVKIGGGGQGSHEFSLDMINDMGLEPPYPKDAKFYDAWRDKVQKYVRAAEDYGDYSASERSLRDVVDYAEANAMAGAGTRYKVNIDAAPNDFLTDGAELSELSPEIQKKLKENGITTTAEMWKATFTPDGARTLSDAGIPGVRYLDQGSRGAGEGTSNYVVFDDALIKILKKYGLSGLLAGGGATYLATADREDPKSGLLAPDL